MFTSCKQVSDFFINGQEYWHESLTKYKYHGSNAWFGRLPEGSFPVASGTEQRGWSLGAMAPPEQIRWRQIVDEFCNSNACSFDPHHISLPGADSYTYSLQRVEALTDWLCLDGFVFKHAIDEEIAHIEQQMRRINRFFKEDFARVSWIHHSSHKWAALLPCEVGDYCGDDCFKIMQGCDNDMRDGMWQFETFSDGYPNKSRIRVALPYDQLYRIAPLSIDMLRSVLIELDAVDPSWSLYGSYDDGDGLEENLISDGSRMLEVILPDLKTRAQLERSLVIDQRAPGGFFADSKSIDPRLGIESTIENFALRYDRDMMRYAPLPPADQPLPVNFDITDPTTWAILEMVPRTYYVPTSNGGRKSVPNRDWNYAPFSLTIPFQRRVGRIEMLPVKNGSGSAQKPSWAQKEAEITWHSPQWPCNIKGNYGFWMFQHNCAFHPRLTELGNPILTRLDHRVKLIEIACDIMAKRDVPSYGSYGCEDVAAGGAVSQFANNKVVVG